MLNAIRAAIVAPFLISAPAFAQDDPCAKISGPGSHVIGLAQDGCNLIIDDSAPGFGAVSIGQEVLTHEGWQVWVKRVWNRFSAMPINAPPGQRIDEFFTRVRFTMPMMSVGFFVRDGRLWTLGWHRIGSDSHRTVASSPYQMSETDCDATLKATPSVAGGGIMIVLPPSKQVTGTQIDDGAASYWGCTYTIVNVDSPGTGGGVYVFPFNGETLNSQAAWNGSGYVFLPATGALQLYQSGDGTKITSLSVPNQ